MRALTTIIRFFFHHFYHTFAWTYDFVAASVSIGRWDDWIEASVPFVQGEDVLEIGHGPGHLQRVLRDRSASASTGSARTLGAGPRQFVIGLDESQQMGQLARRRLKAAGYSDFNLARGLAQALPFPAGAFDTVLATFPSEYIFDDRTISDVHRILREGGRFIVLPAAWIVGRKILDRAAAWLFRITGETPGNILDIVTERFVRPLVRAGFKVESSQVNIQSSIVWILVGNKAPEPPNTPAMV